MGKMFPLIFRLAFYCNIEQISSHERQNSHYSSKKSNTAQDVFKSKGVFYVL